MFRVSALSLVALAAACTIAQAQEAPLAAADIVTEAPAAAAPSPEAAPPPRKSALDGVLTDDERERLRVAGEQTRVVAQEAGVRLKAQAETLAVIVRQQYEAEVDKLLVDVQRALADLRARRQAERGAQNP
jgi:hypothetical protein